MSTPDTLTNGDKPADYFDILDNLRDSGLMNMFGAPAWMERNCELSSTDARNVFLAWVEKLEGQA